MEMKKVWQIVSIIVAIALSLGMTVFAEGEAALKLSAGSAEVKPGDGMALVEIPITVEGELNLNTLQVEISYDKGIKCVEYKKGDVTEPAAEPSVYKNPLTIPFASANSVKFASGTLATFVFEVPTYKAGTYKIDVNVTEAYDDDVEGDPNVISKVETSGGQILVWGDASDEARIAASEERKQDVIALKLNAAIAYANNKVSAIDPDNSKVVPYLKNDRTLVPLRFVSETLGAEVQWEDGWDYCYVIKGDKKIKITFNSADIETNGQVVTYDAPVEVVENRTMVPIRFISEELGYDVKWNQANQMVLITPADNPWKEDGLAELDALESILVTFFFNGVF